MKTTFRSRLIGAAACLGLATAAAAPAGAPVPATTPTDNAVVVPGPQSSLTILPVRVGAAPTSRVSEVIGLLLERRGMTRLELGPVAFTPPPDLSLDDCVVHLRGFLQQNPVPTDFVLYAEFNGTPRAGLTELRAIVVGAGGAEVWREEKRAGDNLPGAWSAREPMTMAALLARDLERRFALNDQTAATARPGAFARIMEERSGLPPAVERDALAARQQRLVAEVDHATFVIYPARIRGSVDPDCAVHLAQQFTEDGIGRACVVAESLLLPGAAPDPNELRALWDLARKFRDHVRAHPPGADYALYADYGYDSAEWQRGFVHFVLCDARGDWVIVDLQNSHHANYQAVKPTTKADCDHILLLRLKEHLRRGDKAPADAPSGAG